MTLVPPSSHGGAAPETLSGASGVKPLDLRVANDTVAALTLSNDTWDTDPTDPVADIYAQNTGDLTIQTHNSGRLLTLGTAGTIIVLKSGKVRWEGATSAPADADLSASQFALWLDATPAATKLMVKAKDSGGTVKTGSLALV